MPVKSVAFVAMFVQVYKAVAVDRFLGLKFSLWFVAPARRSEVSHVLHASAARELGFPVPDDGR